MHLALSRALVCACALLWSCGAAAQNAVGQSAPSFPELFRQVEQSAPRLVEAGATVEAAQGRARQAAAWINPVAGVEVENVAGSGIYHGSSQAQTTFSIAEPLELGGQRGARIAAASAGVRSADAQRLQMRVDFGYELALAYAEAEAAQLRSDLVAEDLSRAQENLRSARALVKAGKEADLRAVQAESSEASAQAELEAARADRIAALAHLSSLAGVAEPYASVTPSLLNPGGRSLAANQSEAAIAQSPRVLTAEAEQNAAERRLGLERKRVIPTPSLSIGTRRFAGDDATAWVFGVSVPLPLFDRNRGDIAAARAEVTAATARATAAHLETEAAWRAAISQQAASESRRFAADRAEAAAREAYRLAQLGYDAGRTPLLELLSTRRALIDAQARGIDARLARVGAEASLARLAGRIPFAE
jgi:cobalt-zinc-cadmium efflux system outer membrane protein